MRIHEAQESDIDHWVELRHALWPGNPIATLKDEAGSIFASSDEVCFLLLDDTGAVVGFAEAALHSGPNGPYGHLEGWYVAPVHRGQGFGKKLIGNVEQWCLHRAIRLLTSDTTPDYPLSSDAHVRSGFKKVHEFAIFMKELQPSTVSD